MRERHARIEAKMEARAQAGVTRVKFAGTVVSSKERITRTGSRMAWVRVSDASGSVEVTCFSEVLSKSRDILVAGSNVTFTLNEETKTITINSAGGASNPTVTWSNVTSKPTSFRIRHSQHHELRVDVGGWS